MSPPYVRPDVRVFLDRLKANPRPPMNESNVAQFRPFAPQGMATLDLPPGELAVVRDVTAPGPDGDIALRLFDMRANREPGPVVVFFHGGGFVMGCIDTHVGLCGEISRQLDLPVISVEYRLAPEHKWPAAWDDAEAATRWIAGHGARFGLSLTGLVLCGDSAGGNLTIVTAMALRNTPAAVPVILQFPIYPSVDRGGHYLSDDLFAEGYGLDRAETAWYIPALQPDLTHWRYAPVVADQTGMPPTLVLTASLDPLRDQGRAYAAKAIAAGVPTTYREAQGTIHGFAGFRRAIPSAQEDLVSALAVAKAMIAEHTPRSA